MSDLIFAKEILKNIDSTNGVRTIRGLYITGVWRPPHFIERHLFITDIGTGSRQATVHNYSEQTMDYRPSNYLCGVDEFTYDDTTFSVLKFTTLEMNERPSNYLCGVDTFKFNTSIQLTKFTTLEMNARPSNYLCGVDSFKYQHTIDTTKMNIDKLNSECPGKPSLTITAISSIPATITIST